MTQVNRQSELKSLRSVREHRVRIRQAALAAQEQALQAAMALQRQCEQAVEQAVQEHAQYERDVFDRMVLEPQAQGSLRDAMVRLKALGMRIEQSRQLVVHAQRNTAACAERHAVARAQLNEAARAELKVAELIEQLQVIDARDAERRQEDAA